MKAIECKGVSKCFGKITALDHINFQLEAGKIYALLGRNGAGKTTLLNCLCTKYLPDEGEINILEEPAYENENVLKQICFMSDQLPSFESSKVSFILNYASWFYADWNQNLMEQLLNLFEIRQSDRYAALSKGKQTAVSIVIGLCSGCKVVLLDEIYSGLDAVARQQFYEILLNEQEQNPRTFLLSTHLIEEMTGLFDGVLIMHKGSILLQEDMEALHSKSFKCVGRTGKADCFHGKNVIYKKVIGSVTEYSIYDTFTTEERKQLENEGFSISSLSLQELFIAMTGNATTEWGETIGTN